MIPVTSRNIELVGYDAETCEMHIQYRSGHIYAFYSVPEEVLSLLTLTDRHLLSLLGRLRGEIRGRRGGPYTSPYSS